MQGEVLGLNHLLPTHPPPALGSGWCLFLPHTFGLGQRGCCHYREDWPLKGSGPLTSHPGWRSSLALTCKPQAAPPGCQLASSAALSERGTGRPFLCSAWEVDTLKAKGRGSPGVGLGAAVESGAEPGAAVS